MRGYCAGEVCRAAGAGDDDAHAADLEPIDPLAKRIGRAMRGQDAHLVFDPQSRQRLRGLLHDRPVAGGAHHDRDLVAAHEACTARGVAMSERWKALGKRMPSTAR